MISRRHYDFYIIRDMFNESRSESILLVYILYCQLSGLVRIHADAVNNVSSPRGLSPPSTVTNGENIHVTI
jgi:hypothetical protein